MNIISRLFVVIRLIHSSIVNREEGLAAGGMARLCYCSMSRDKTSALLKQFVIGEVQRIRFYLC